MVAIENFQKLFANSHYEEDLEIAIQLNRRLLKPIGMWPVNSKSPKEKFIANLLRIGCIMIILFLFEICVCFEIMSNDWRSVSSKNREIMLKSANTARKIIILCAIFMFTGSLSFTVFFPLLDNYFASENATVRNTGCCSLTCGICSVTISFVMHISGQLEIVNGFLQLLVKETSSTLQVTEKMISLIVKQHLKSLRFAEHLENIMNEICLIEFLSSSFGICLIGYYILWEFKNNDITKMVVYCILLTSYIFNIFIYCFLSELLLTKCQDVGKQSYMIPEWNYLPKKKSLDLILIILISSKPVKLTAGKIVSFSIGCFCSVLKVSAAYLNILRSFLN
ncbi:odorant receptor 85b-like [Leptopilina heterotoma]|uniref:odorant receptor 85b-like n=1 Tax=Leptopilina heterotoma TaxID=63436 RepID=UPI001CA95757|nr:odorant receptor 85b-like [Leptopilina heterotoma]